MPPPPAAARSLALAALGFGLGAADAFAQMPTPGNAVAVGPVSQAAAPAGSSTDRFIAWPGGVAYAPPSYSGVFSDEPGSVLPTPPPGQIQNRLIAVPETGKASVAPAPAAKPAPLAAVAPPAPVAPPVALSAPPPAPMPSTPLGPATRVLFAPQSTELGADAKGELDRAAVMLAQTRAWPIELRAYASGAGSDSRKVSLARALAVRSYLIERGVRGKMDVSANLAQAGAATSDRVDIVLRGPQ